MRLSHEQWWAILAKQNRQQMASRLGATRSAITAPQVIQFDRDAPNHLFYYTEPADADGKVLFVDVKCLPERSLITRRPRPFRTGAVQRRYAAVGRLTRHSWGEAWVSSAYFAPGPKARGVHIWP